MEKMKVEFTEYTLQSAGCTLHYWLGGTETAPLLVFTHGALIDHQEWTVTPELAVEKGYRVLYWDMRGHGKSRPALFDFSQAVEDLLAILDTLKVDKATFIGHSLGGNLHQEFVFRHPERVRSMVVLDSTWNFQKMTRFEEWSLRYGTNIFKWYPYKSLIKQMVAVTFSKPADKAMMAEICSHLTREEIVQIMTEATLCLHTEPNYQIPVPFLLLVADDDVTGNIRKVAPIWAAHDPNCQYVVIPNALHGAHLDNPEFFHAQLFGFLEQHAR